MRAAGWSPGVGVGAMATLEGAKARLESAIVTFSRAKPPRNGDFEQRPTGVMDADNSDSPDMTVLSDSEAEEFVAEIALGEAILATGVLSPWDENAAPLSAPATTDAATCETCENSLREVAGERGGAGKTNASSEVRNASSDASPNSTSSASSTEISDGRRSLFWQVWMGLPGEL